MEKVYFISSLSMILLSFVFMATGYPAICDRTKEVHETISAMVGKGCSDVSDADLGTIKSLNLWSKGMDTLKGNDLEGLSNLQWLRLSDNRLRLIPEEFFRGLIELEVIYLDSNKLNFLPEGLFSGLIKLRWLSLANNKFSTVEKERIRNSLPKEVEVIF
ncbi:MAG: hypothetical protein A3F16_02805 [Deltaproteobacteria bacterium RIFCSPHIGHO2_12_FULL_43_9]|nr:MAG: hypothetical protein A3F16_02805 [Deltaproteobacteria bacterium RIFCSPHIGHO2_12_FULL_43_9]